VRQRSFALVDVVMLPDGQDVRPSRRGPLDGRQRVVRTGGQIDDRELGVDQRAIEFGGGGRACRLGPGKLDGLDQPLLPDQVLGQDRDPRRQPRVSAR
jgi:hypothetical protein